MIDFLKRLLKIVNFKTDNENINKYNKILYTVIILCAIGFIGLIIFFVVRNLPNFVSSAEESLENAKNILRK